MKRRACKMRQQLLSKITLLSALGLSLTACGDGPNYEDAANYENVEPVTIEGDLVINVDEMQGELEFDMLEGVTNPANTQVYAREFEYLGTIEDSDGNEQPNFQGPQLPFSSIYQSLNSIFISTDAWKEELVHPFTSENTPETFSEGVYKFRYAIDNGAEELQTRNVIITVNGVEDVVTDVIINHEDGFSIAKDYTVQLSTAVEPLNATFQQLAFTSSDTSKASISQTGLITGLDYGVVTFTVTSVDGLITKTITGVVEDLAEPLGIDIVRNGEVITELSIPVETTIDLDHVLLPDTVEFDNEVMWSAEPVDVLQIDENTGEVTALSFDAENPDFNLAKITAYDVDNPSIKGVVQVSTTASSNEFFELNPGFESGEAFPWTNYWETTEGAAAISITEAAAKDGVYGVHFVSDGANHAGFTLPALNAPQALGEGQGRKFLFSYDVKLNNYDGGDNPLRLYFSAEGAWGDRIEKWHNPINSVDWTHVEVEIDEKDWSAVENKGRFDLYFIKNNGPIDAYFDNFRLEPIKQN